jgi:hypothetical protein
LLNALVQIANEMGFKESPYMNVHETRHAHHDTGGFILERRSKIKTS